MNLTDLQVELRSLASSVDERLSALHREIEKMKPHDKPQLNIDFARITSVAARHPLTLKQLQAAPPATQKSFLAALAYFTALDSTCLEDKLYYLCRLAQGCEYQPTAEEFCQLGLNYSSTDLEFLHQHLEGLEDWFVVQALVLANLGGPAVRETLSSVAALADSLDIEGEKMSELGLVAQTVLRTGRSFATMEQANFWGAHTDCKVGDIFTFGSYPQSDNSEVKPIEWQVLRRDNDCLWVISRYALNCKRYNESQCDTNWSECTLRKW